MQSAHSAYLSVVLGAAILFGAAPAKAVEATLQQQTCAQELVVLGGQWDAIGLPPSGKPAQGLV